MFLKNTSFFCCFPKPSKFHNLTVSELQKTFIWEGGTIQAGLWFAIYNTQTNKVLPSQKTLKNFVSWRNSSGRETWSRAYVYYLRYLNKKSLPCQKTLTNSVSSRSSSGRETWFFDYFQNCPFLAVFETFLKNGWSKIEKKVDFWACALNTSG